MKNIILLFILAISHFAEGQNINPQLISSSGDIFALKNAQLSWSLGEVLSETFSAGEITISHGFQQVFEEMIPIGLEEDDDLSSSILAYPNPAHNLLNIRISAMEKDNIYTAILSDMQGKKILIHKTKEKLFQLNLENIVPGIYLLCVSNNDAQNRLFKIIKSN